MQRGDSNLWKGNTAEAVKDYARAMALARETDDRAFLAGALLLEAQALMAAGSVDEAAARLDEARQVGTPVDANILYYLDTFVGDLAVADGRPADALEPYGLDLVCVAEALAALGHDAEALEVAGMAESQSAEFGASSDTLYDEHLRALEQRVGPNKATALEQHARAASPADRAARACQLARSHALPPAVAREEIEGLRNHAFPLHLRQRSATKSEARGLIVWNELDSLGPPERAHMPPWSDKASRSAGGLHLRRKAGASSAEERLTKAIAAHRREPLVTKQRIVADAVASFTAVSGAKAIATRRSLSARCVQLGNGLRCLGWH